MSQKIAVITMYAPGSRMSLTCNVTIDNRYNIMRLVEDALRQVAIDQELREKKIAPEADTSEAMSN